MISIQDFNSSVGVLPCETADTAGKIKEVVWSLLNWFIYSLKFVLTQLGLRWFYPTSLLVFASTSQRSKSFRDRTTLNQQGSIPHLHIFLLKVHPVNMYILQ